LSELPARLSLCKPRPWHRRGNTAVVGAAFVAGRLLRDAALHEHFHRARTARGFHQRVRGASDFFATVVERRGAVWAAMDRVRGYPLYFAGAGAALIAEGDEKRHGYPGPILAYTCGRPNSREARVSRAVAERLGIPWHFVEHHPRTWRRWFLSESRRRLHAGAHDVVTLPCFHDAPAFEALCARGVIAPDAVVLPGCSGDLLGGCRVHEVSGRAWWMPLWDDLLVDFFMTVPLQHRAGLKPYRTYVDHLYETVGGAPAGELPRYLQKGRPEVGSRPHLRRARRELLRHVQRLAELWLYLRDPLALYGVMGLPRYLRLADSVQSPNAWLVLDLLGIERLDR